MLKYGWCQNERCETKTSILKWDSENGTQPAILKMRQKRRFVVEQVASLGLSPKEISVKRENHYIKQPILFFFAIIFF